MFILIFAFKFQHISIIAFIFKHFQLFLESYVLSVLGVFKSIPLILTLIVKS